MSTGGWNLGVSPASARTYLSGASSPEDFGLKALTIDPGTTIAGLSLAAGQINAFRIRLLRPELLTGAVAAVQVAGATLTTDQNLVGLYSIGGTRLAQTATQHTNWTSTGWRQAAWTAPYNAPAGDYFLALLFNGTTSPQFSRQNNVITANGLLTTPLASLRSIRTVGGGNTSLPATTDFSTWEINGNMALVGVY